MVKSEGKWERIENSKCKIVEETAIKATKDWEHIFDAVPDLISIIDTNYRIVRVNRAMASKLGVTPEECIGLTCYRIIHGTTKPPSFCPHRQLLKDGFEHTSEICEDCLGGYFIVSVSPLYDSEGKLTGSIHVARDINERRQMEEALRESEEKYRNLIETANEGIGIVDAEFKITYVNKKIEEMFGHSTEESIGRSIWDSMSEESKAIIKSDLEKNWQGFNGSLEIKHIRKDGSAMWTLVNAKSLYNKDGKFVGTLGMLTDITERKQVEKALQESETHFRALAENSPDIITRFDRQYRHVYANPAAVESYDISLDEIIGKTLGELGRALKKVKIWEEHLEKTFIMGKIETLEYNISVQGKKYYYNTKIVPEFIGDKVISVLAISRDITDIKESEAKLKETLDNLENLVKERTEELQKAYNLLKESERGLAEAQRMAHIGNWVWDIRTDKAYWSDELYCIFERNPQESAPTYHEYLNYVHPDDLEYVADAFKKGILGENYSIDHRIILAHGEERTIHIKSEIIFDEKNTPVQIKGIVQDITERKKSDEKIRNLANIVESSNDAIGTISLEGTITSWNKGAEQVYGYSAKEILGKSISKLAPSHLDGETKKLIERIKQGESINNYETLRLRKDGKRIDVSITLSPVFDLHGKMTAISLISRDITKRIETEKALAEIEIARKKEIHHRIKNNLQVISSLLDLQADKFNNRECIQYSEVLEAFRESQDCVISMALIHEELYKGEGLEKLNFSPYIEKLVENLFHTYSFGNTDISLKLNLEQDVFFDMDIAVPLGMIINELISNSFKHAFPGRNEGEIQIKLHKESGEYIKNIAENCKSTSFTLSISDDGVGIPENLDIEELDSLGLQLVTSLVDQLEGKFELNRNNGTEFIMKFTVTEKDNQASAAAQNN